MKITSVAAAYTNKWYTGFRTTPPLSTEVFAYAYKYLFHESYHALHTYSFEDGVIIVRNDLGDPPLQLQARLMLAENAVARLKQLGAVHESDQNPEKIESRVPPVRRLICIPVE